MTACLTAIATALATGCAGPTPPETSAVVCTDPAAAPELPAPAAPECGNEALLGYDELLVVAPHPDDEVLGFAGLITGYLEQGKPVEVIVTTDGDAYCDACRFWKSGTVRGATCDALDLSNFATPEIDSFAEMRRAESTAALAVLEAGTPTFLGYPDTGLAAAWANHQAGEPSKPLRRSDFSACEACEGCAAGYGGGPEIELTASTLMETLGARLAATSEGALLATTHWLDGHGDHAGLGSFVKLLNSELDAPRAVAHAVIHAHTPKDAPHADCWYPDPRGLDCACANQDCTAQDPGWIAALRAYRFRPEWPAALPDDADYGPETQLCLPEELYAGETARKRLAVEAYASQLGFAARSGVLQPERAGILDCSGYLISFIRSTEAFVLLPQG